ncbi:MAG TPA: chemotaxis protein CheW [Vicinamibacterales bacterium]|nr:chemotaxis protein CheW [Vicinamibacterales bacterium]
MSASTGFVCLVLGDELYAVRDGAVLAIARVDEMQPGGAADDNRIGTLALGTQLVPVHSLARALGAPAPPAGRHIVVSPGPNGTVGWSVDRAYRAGGRIPAEVQALPALVGPRAAEWFEGVVVVDGRAMLLLSTSAHRPSVSETPKQVRQAAGAAAVPPPPEAPPFVVTFSSPSLPPCAADRYALSARQVVTITSAPATLRVPGSPAHVAGVAPCNGGLATVVDFRPLSARQPHAGRELRLLVARTGSSLREPIAFAVDAAVALHRPDLADRERTVADESDFVLGVFEVGDGAIALLDLDALVTPRYGATPA